MKTVYVLTLKNKSITNFSVAFNDSQIATNVKNFYANHGYDFEMKAVIVYNTSKDAISDLNLYIEEEK